MHDGDSCAAAVAKVSGADERGNTLWTAAAGVRGARETVGAGGGALGGAPPTPPRRRPRCCRCQGGRLSELWLLKWGGQCGKGGGASTPRTLRAVASRPARRRRRPALCRWCILYQSEAGRGMPAALVGAASPGGLDAAVATAAGATLSLPPAGGDAARGVAVVLDALVGVSAVDSRAAAAVGDGGGGHPAGAAPSAATCCCCALRTWGRPSLTVQTAGPRRLRRLRRRRLCRRRCRRRDWVVGGITGGGADAVWGGGRRNRCPHRPGLLRPLPDAGMRNVVRQ